MEDDVYAGARWGQEILAEFAPGISCIPQEWDGRVDCLVRLSDGRTIGEMIRLADLTDERLRETGERLRLAREGVDVTLVDPVLPPILIRRMPSDRPAD
jgi:hypothetical protein